MNTKNKPARKFRSQIIGNLLSETTPTEQQQTKTKMSIAARLHDIIIEKGWSKSEFAEKLHKNPSEITKWLSGTQNFTIDTLVEISIALSIPVSELLMQKQNISVNHTTILVTIKPETPPFKYITPSSIPRPASHYQFSSRQRELAN